jgi:hypothetical protein
MEDGDRGPGLEARRGASGDREAPARARRQARGLLLYTERPHLLERERATHDFVLRERPAERLGLELVYDNSPGGWIHYFERFKLTWKRAAWESVPLMVLESDVLPTLETMAAMLACPSPICVNPYENVMLGGDGHRCGAIIETRVRGGWECHFAGPNDEWAVDADLGLCCFKSGAFRVPFPQIGLQDDLLINTALFRALRSKNPRDTRGRVHLHWPAARNFHSTWDSGDDEHHPLERIPEMHRVHARWLDPSLK